MKRSELLSQMETILEVDEGSLKEDAALSDIPDFDSLAVLSLIALFDKHFNKIISGESILSCSKVNDILDLVT